MTGRGRGRGNRSTPANPLPISSLRHSTPVADTVEVSDDEPAGSLDRRPEAERFSEIEEQARLSPKRKLRTRSQASARVTAAPKPSRRGRQTTPDEDQLQQELRQASEEAEVPARPTVDAPPSSVAEYSSVSWVTERLEFERQEAEREKEALQEQESQQAQHSQPSHQVKQQRDQEEPRPTAAHHRTRTAGQSARHVEPASSSLTSLSASVNPVVNVPVLKPTGQQITNAPPRKEKREPVAPSAAPRRHNPSAPVLEMRLNPIPFVLLGLLLAILAGGTLFMFGDNIKGAASKIPIAFSFPGCGSACAAAPFPSDAFNKVLSTVDQKLADMAKDVATFKEDIHNRVSDISIPANPLMPPRVNYMSVRLGAEIDMHMTSPMVVAKQPSFVERVVRRLANTLPEGMAPVIVLQPWEEVGECWCSPGSSSQLVVMLGYPIVPDEVIVEHIAKGATLSPFLAPRHMELWAEYIPVTDDDLDLTAPDAAFNHPGSGTPIIPPSSAPSSEPSSSAKEPVRPSGHATLPHLPRLEHEYILSTLRMTYPDEPDEAFSYYPQLGPSFFRLGKWEYDLDAEQNIQRFKLDAVINIPGLRVQRVAVRTVSNWGGPFTCLYRVRLHGKY